MFFITDDVNVASYTDNNTSCTHGKLPSKVLEKLECASRNIFEWLFNNAVKANLNKCHFLSILDMSTKITVSIFDIDNANLKKFLGVTIDRKLNFHDHVSNLYKKVSANTA